MFAYYICGYGASEDYNILDRGIIYRVHQLKSKLLHLWRTTERWEVILRKSVLMFSDQQVVTGIAILVAAFLQLSRGISSYHWQIVVYAAWFASVTHLSTLTFLRPLFLQKAALRIWRLVLMGTTVLMLAVALLPTADSSWMRAHTDQSHVSAFTGSIPAKCFFKRLGDLSRIDPRSAQFVSLLCSMIILIYGYCSRAAQISFMRSPWSRLLSGLKRYVNFHDILRNLYVRIHGPFRSLPWIFLYVSIHTLLILTKVISALYGSLLWEVGFAIPLIFVALILNAKTLKRSLGLSSLSFSAAYICISHVRRRIGILAFGILIQSGQPTTMSGVLDSASLLFFCFCPFKLFWKNIMVNRLLLPKCQPMLR